MYSGERMRMLNSTGGNFVYFNKMYGLLKNFNPN